MRNIAAFTATDGIYPAFVSINEHEDNKVSISLREASKLNAEGFPVCGDQSEVIIMREQFSDLIGQMVNWQQAQ